MPRDWTELGSVTVRPDDLSVVVGSFDIDEGDDTIWFDVQAVVADTFWPWSYGILSWRTENGYELGSCKAYTESVGEMFRIGVGRAPRSRRGSVIYEPRSFNLGWIKKGNPLTLRFAAASGATSSGGGGSVAFPVVDGDWFYAATSGLLQLKL